MKTYTFASLDEQILKYIFGLNRIYDAPLLFENWLQKASDYQVEDAEKRILSNRQEKLIRHVNHWNESELHIKFITFVLELVDFDIDEYDINSFSERILTKKINNIELHGRVDWMVAIGLKTPQQPFFFIHEYKKSLENTGDPIGQLLGTMYAAQALNNEPPKRSLFPRKTYKDLPIYGCYMVGRYWYFVTLKDKEYYISPSYDATKTNELHEIVKLLKAQKQLIIERVKKNN